jgi:preprotein translocase subunit SecD
MAYALRRFLFSSLSLWLALAIFGVYFLNHLSHYVNFGIDLVGGTYLTLEVQMDQVLDNELSDQVTAQLKTYEDQGRTAPQEIILKNHEAIVTFVTSEDAQAVEALVPLTMQKILHIKRYDNHITYALRAEEIKKLTHEAVESNIKVLRTRINQFGAGEITIAAQGDKHIIVELPQVQDSQKAKNMIGTSALLEIKPVLDTAETAEELLGRHKGKLPDGTMIVSHHGKGHGVFLVPRRSTITGKMLKGAQALATGGHFGIEPVVNFQLTTEGGDKFYALTSRGNNPQIAMLIDNVVVTAARAKEPLRSEASISGNFSLEQAQELAALLRSGAFVAPVRFVEDRTIGPSLGAEAIRQGLIACAAGIILLFLFTIIVYRMAGLFAFTVLLFNILLILFAMALLKATLTLPGIAGMVLTLGMAVDASVLIYERIREELAAGLNLSLAIQNGFSGALVVILDANITTFLAALVLYKIGSGPIQGFAVTMMVGILSTLITGLILLRSIFSYAIEGLGMRKLSI